MKTETDYYVGNAWMVWRVRDGKVTVHSGVIESMDSDMPVTILNEYVRCGRLIEMTKKQADMICGRKLN